MNESLTLQHSRTHCNALQHTVTHYTYECVKSHTWMRHATHINVSRHAYECVTSHTWMSPCSARSCVRCSRTFAAYDEWVMSHTLIRPCHIWVMSHARMVHFHRCVQLCQVLAHLCRLQWMSHVTHMNEACHTHEGAKAHMNESRWTHKRVTSRAWMSHVTNMNEPCGSWCSCAMCSCIFTAYNKSVISHICKNHVSQHDWFMIGGND